jgi:hypothetical protein
VNFVVMGFAIVFGVFAGLFGVDAVEKALEPVACQAWAEELEAGLDKAKYQFLGMQAGVNAQLAAWLDPETGDVHLYAVVNPAVSALAEEDGFRDLGACTLPDGRTARRMLRVQPPEQASAPAAPAASPETSGAK